MTARIEPLSLVLDRFTYSTALPRSSRLSTAGLIRPPRYRVRKAVVTYFAQL